jgi:hypothetical protein
MKKNILYIIPIIITLTLSNQVSADECSQSCKIADAPAPALTEYLTNLSSIKSNILDTLSEAESEIEEISGDEEDSGFSQVNSWLNSAKDKTKWLLASLNSLLSFNDYFWNFDFKITLPITNEVPKEVTRDHRKIESETERFMQILKKAENRWTAWAKITNVCSGVSNCTLWDLSVRDLLLKVIKNNKNITRLYETSILDKAFLAENRNFILVSDDFESQIETYYNKDTLGSCSKCEWNTWATLWDKIKNISFKNGTYKEWVQKWKDAWALLRWGKASWWQEAVQTRLLNEYLWEQWISGSQADVVLDNLNKYSSWGLSSSNPLFNSESYAQASIENEIDTFSQTLQEQFAWEEKVPIVANTKVNSEIKATEDLKSEIKSIFEDQLPFAQWQDVASQELQLRILRMHFSLIRSINMLDKNKKSTEKLCDKQGTGDWKCSYE